jgi:thymidylate synthase
LQNIYRRGLDDLGPIYGSQWRNYNGQGIDQLANAVNDVIYNPTSRRIKVEAWNPAMINKTALPPCHTGFQLYVNTRDNELSMTMNQRSCDMFLGIPFNIASYALLLHIIAEATGRKPRFLKMFLTDCHIYENHVEQVKEQLTREEYPLPKLHITPWNAEFSPPPIEYIEGLDPCDIHLVDYISHSALKAPMAV